MDNDSKITRDQQRSRRKRAVRALTIYAARYPKRDLERDKALYPEADVDRPRTRQDCAGGPRPCPFVSCRYHLYLEVSEAGNIKLNFPDLEVWELEHSCALDVSEAEDLEVEELGKILNVTRERVRQIVHRSLAKISDTLGLTSKPSEL
jgi:predicted DNA-binding protein (UPF0251 family)